ncbi:MAG: hypothetical protein ACK5Y2_00030 [Bdellovibrionales bacterium]
MKNAYLVVIVSLLSSVSFAQAKMYLVEPMKCTGRLVSNNPSMHPSWKNKIYEWEFTSFKSTRRGGTLADSLEIKSSTTSYGYTSPLFIERDGSIKKQIGAYRETLRLQVVSSRADGHGNRIDHLVGTVEAIDTVVGDTAYNVNCTARVVKKVTRIDNHTAGN